MQVKNTNKSWRVKTLIKQLIRVFEQRAVNKIPFAQLTGDNILSCLSWCLGLMLYIYKFAPFREEVTQTGRYFTSHYSTTGVAYARRRQVTEE